jgi:hypothetical protein
VRADANRRISKGPFLGNLIGTFSPPKDTPQRSSGSVSFVHGTSPLHHFRCGAALRWWLDMRRMGSFAARVCAKVLTAPQVGALPRGAGSSRDQQFTPPKLSRVHSGSLACGPATPCPQYTPSGRAPGREPSDRSNFFPAQGSIRRGTPSDHAPAFGPPTRDGIWCSAPVPRRTDGAGGRFSLGVTCRSMNRWVELERLSSASKPRSSTSLAMSSDTSRDQALAVLKATTRRALLYRPRLERSRRKRGRTGQSPQ